MAGYDGELRWRKVMERELGYIGFLLPISQRRALKHGIFVTRREIYKPYNEIWGWKYILLLLPHSIQCSSQDNEMSMIQFLGSVALA
jgi:hypothetical protein